MIVLKKFLTMIFAVTFLFCTGDCGSDKSDNLSTPIDSSEFKTETEIQPTNKVLTEKEINGLEDERYIRIQEAIDIHEQVNPKNNGGTQRL